MPIRQVSMDNNLRIWRSFSLGKLVDLIMLDTRNYDRSITTLGGWNDDYITEISNDAGRTLMGSDQENWCVSLLISSRPTADSLTGSTANSFPAVNVAPYGVSSVAKSSSLVSTFRRGLAPKRTHTTATLGTATWQIRTARSRHLQTTTLATTS